MDEHTQIPARLLKADPQKVTLQIAGQNVELPRDHVPGDVREGETVQVQILSERMALTDKHEQARAILAEILGGRT